MQSCVLMGVRPMHAPIHAQAHSEFVADITALLLCLVVYASLEAAKPRATFLVTDLLYYYSYPLKVSQRPCPCVPYLRRASLGPESKRYRPATTP